MHNSWNWTLLLYFTEGVIVPLLMIVSEWNIDSVLYEGYICLSQGLNGEPRKVTCGTDFWHHLIGTKDCPSPCLFSQRCWTPGSSVIMLLNRSCRVRDQTFFGSLSLEEAGVKDAFSPVSPKNVHVKSIIHLMRMCVCPSLSFNHELIQRLIKTLCQERRMSKGMTEAALHISFPPSLQVSDGSEVKLRANLSHIT